MPDAETPAPHALAAHTDRVVAALADPDPGARRRAARALERDPAPDALPALRDALAWEPTDTGRLALARAALACGASRSEARAHLAVAWVTGPTGPVDPGAGVGVTPGGQIQALDAPRADESGPAPTDEAGIARAIAADGRPAAWPALVCDGLPRSPVAAWAIGEIGSRDAAPALVTALADDALAPVAAAALLKLGPAVTGLVAAALDGPGAAWAAGVLVRLDPARAVSLAADPRPEVRRAADLADLADPDEAAGLADLRARRWYDAHEALESAWRRATGDRRRFLQALVHAAVSLEHRRRGHPDRGRGQWARCREKLEPPWRGAPPTLRAWLDAVDAVHRDAAGPPEAWPIPD